MGYSNWSGDFYRDREAERAKTGRDAFVYDSAMRSTPTEERTCHADMNPHGVTRESRDSDEHPESVAIAVVIDQTGSMSGTPRVLQQALPKLMTQLVEGGCPHPQVMFAAVGDETNREKASLQIGQFESGIEMDDDLGKIYMEGMGGGSFQESYQNAIYFFARHTEIDCHTKRGEKGYLFIVGDEQAYDHVKKNEIKSLFGDDVQADIPIADIVAEASEKYHVYFVIPAGTNHAGDVRLIDFWNGLLGNDHVIQLPDASHICECITSTVTTGETPRDSIPATRNVRL